MSMKRCSLFLALLGSRPPTSERRARLLHYRLIFISDDDLVVERPFSEPDLEDFDIVEKISRRFMGEITPLCIEVCVDCVRSALNAVQGGADRLEVCGNLGVGGGTTPSLGLLKSIQASVEVPLMVMIRPRTGDFLYSEDEIEVMLEDIRVFKEYNVSGVVLGALKADGRVDVDVTKRLVDEALPLQVCFHRAFDMTRDPAEALADVISIGGVSRILTSGHAQTALEALDTLESLCVKTQQLAKELPWVLNVLPGSGINSDSVGPLLDALLPQGLMELHLSGGGWEESAMVHRKDGLGMGVGAGEWGVWVTSEAKVRAVRRFADAVWKEYAGSMEEAGTPNSAE